MRTVLHRMTPKAQLLQRIGCRKAVVGIVGMGYVGLPLAMTFADAGFQVVGVDINAARVDALNEGRSHIEDIESEHLARHRDGGLFEATADFARLAECDAIAICVPTPLRKTRDPDMSFVMQATEQVATHLRAGQLIVLESTTYPGTTRELVLPEFEARGLTVGDDVFLVFSPERVDPGRTDFTTQSTPKVMGGVTPACMETAEALYGAAFEAVVPVSSPEVAEMSKVFENTFRAVNIGLANELLLMCDKLDISAWEVIDAAATKPFGFMRFTPGPGLGGHCIPVDPHYLSWKLRGLNYTARFIELASEINTRMPRFWAQRVQDSLNTAGQALNGADVLVLGVAYKPDVSDLRESPALDIIGLLAEKGALVQYHDPFVPAFTHDGVEFSSVPDLDSAVSAADCVVLVTDHTLYDMAAIAESARTFVNTRGPQQTRSPHPETA